MDEPGPGNGFQAAHADLLLSSFRRLLGRDLLPPGPTPGETAERLYLAPFAVLSHDTAADPVLTYVNRHAQALWEGDWSTLTAMPSRLTAEPMERESRARFLAESRARGVVEGYEGVRISLTGRRFRIAGAVIWTLADAAGRPLGQAATFDRVLPP